MKNKCLPIQSLISSILHFKISTGKKYFHLLIAFIFLQSLFGCKSELSEPTNSPNTVTYTISGNIQGLKGTVVLQSSSLENISVSENGDFVLSNTVHSQGSYDFIVLTQPEHQTCRIINGKGVINDASITNISINCTDITLLINVKVSGLSESELKLVNGKNSLSVKNSGEYSFSEKITEGDSYKIDIVEQPPGYKCTLENSHGTVIDEVNNTLITCIENITPNATTSPRIRSQRSDKLIIVNFSESMNTDSLVIAANIAQDNMLIEWFSELNENDTVHIKPLKEWSEGVDQEIVINATDLAGNPISTLTLHYDFFPGEIFFVNSSAANDEGDGTSPINAKQTINAAISVAMSPATIVVSQGDYNVNYLKNTQIKVKDGISLYGGYSADFMTRESGANHSIIRDENRKIIAIAPESHTVIEVPIPLYQPTIISGFKIYGRVSAVDENNSVIFNDQTDIIEEIEDLLEEINLTKALEPELRKLELHFVHETNRIESIISSNLIFLAYSEYLKLADEVALTILQINGSLLPPSMKINAINLINTEVFGFDSDDDGVIDIEGLKQMFDPFYLDDLEGEYPATQSKLIALYSNYIYNLWEPYLVAIYESQCAIMPPNENQDLDCSLFDTIYGYSQNEIYEMTNGELKSLETVIINIGKKVD